MYVVNPKSKYLGDLKMQLRYFVPFKAQEGVSAQYALKEKLVNIEGVAIDTSVNANKWQVLKEDLILLLRAWLGLSCVWTMLRAR